MTTLNIALKANQASTLPALLIAIYAKESNADIRLTINYDDVDTLKSGDKESIELAQENDTPSYGCNNVINKLLSTYPFLQGKHEELVSNIKGYMESVDLCLLD